MQQKHLQRKNNKTKQTAKNKLTGHKKSFQLKTSICRDETLNNQPNKMAMTPQYFHTLPSLHLVPFCKPCIPQNSLHTS